MIAITSPTGGSGSGDIYTWGCGSSGQLGLGDDVYNIERCHVQIPRRVQVWKEEKKEENRLWGGYCEDFKSNCKYFVRENNL